MPKLYSTSCRAWMRLKNYHQLVPTKVHSTQCQVKYIHPHENVSLLQMQTTVLLILQRCQVKAYYMHRYLLPNIKTTQNQVEWCAYTHIQQVQPCFSTLLNIKSSQSHKVLGQHDDLQMVLHSTSSRAKCYLWFHSTLCCAKSPAFKELPKHPLDDYTS